MRARTWRKISALACQKLRPHRIEIIDVGSLLLLNCPVDVYPIHFPSWAPVHSPLLFPNSVGLAVGDSCPSPPDERDERGSKVVARACPTHGGGPPFVGMAAAAVVWLWLAFCAHHR